jgi:hypothetical protein
MKSLLTLSIYPSGVVWPSPGRGLVAKSCILHRQFMEEIFRMALTVFTTGVFPVRKTPWKIVSRFSAMIKTYIKQR